jgi:hypothetical protein
MIATAWDFEDGIIARSRCYTLLRFAGSRAVEGVIELLT